MPGELYTDADVELAVRAPGKLYDDTDRRLTRAAIAHWTGAQGDRLEAATTAVLATLTVPGSPLVARIWARAGEDVAATIEEVAREVALTPADAARIARAVTGAEGDGHG